MKTQKLIRSVFNDHSSDRTNGMIALVAGLAAGAVIGILFATKTGATAREKIRDAANRLFGTLNETAEQPVEIPARHKEIKKRPKSDIGDLIHQAHSHEEGAEQSLAE